MLHLRRLSTFYNCFIFALGLLIQSVVSSHVYAQSDQAGIQAELKDLEADVRSTQAEEDALRAEAKSIQAEIRRLNDDLISAAQDTQDQEDIITNLEGQLGLLRRDQEARLADLGVKRETLSQMLSALTSLTRNPPQAFFLYPGEPIEAVQASIALQTVIPNLRGRARNLREELTALQAVELDIEEKLESLKQAGTRLETERSRIDRLIAQKRILQQSMLRQARQKDQKVQALVGQAQNLQDLLDGLARLDDQPDELVLEQDVPSNMPRPPIRPGANTQADITKHNETPETLEGSETDLALAILPEGMRPFPAQGRIILPARGQITQKYGQNLQFGQVSRGIGIKTRNQAQIVATFDGKIVYAGPFRDEGQIIVIEHLGGYHSVITGLSRIDVVVGQWLLAGEPIGIVTKDGDVSEDHRLYLEVRRDGQPVNPMKWIS